MSSQIVHVGWEHGRSSTGCWAHIVYREAGWTLRMTTCDSKELTGVDENVVEIDGPDSAPIPLDVLNKAVDLLDTYSRVNTGYQSNGHCTHRPPERDL